MKKLIACLVVFSLVFAFSVELAEADEPEVELTIAGGSVGAELEATEKAAEMYMEENPHVEVDVLDTPDETDERRSLYLQFFEAESSEVDVMQIDVMWPGDMQEHLLDLYEYGAEDYVDRHIEGIVDNNTTADGELVAMPWFVDAGLIYYRDDLLEEYDLEVPETWAELEEAARIIQEGEREDNPDFHGFVWQGDAYEGLTCNVLEWFASNDGGNFVSHDEVVTVLNDNNQYMLEKAAGWVGDITPEGVTGYAEEDARAVFQDGNAAFMRNWPYAYPLAEESEAFEPEDFDVTEIPAGPEGESAATLGGWQIAASEYSEHPEYAADLALFLASEEVQKERALIAGDPPTIEDLYEDEEILEAYPYWEDFFDVFVNAVPRPSTVTAPDYEAVSEAIFSETHDVLTGEQDALTALEYMEIRIMDVTGFPPGEPN